jgi:hypothetical protein
MQIVGHRNDVLNAVSPRGFGHGVTRSLLQNLQYLGAVRLQTIEFSVTKQGLTAFLSFRQFLPTLEIVAF